jgi:hypothetical protein
MLSAVLTPILLAFAVAASGQTTKQADVNGWQELRWGMTPAEVKAAFVRMSVKEQGREVRSGDLFLYYSFALHERLGSAVLEEARCSFDGLAAEEVEQRPLWHVALRFARGTAGYRELVAALREKYGKAEHSTQGTLPLHVWKWKLAKTEITLEGSDEEGPLQLSYVDVKKVAALQRLANPPVDKSRL